MRTLHPVKPAGAWPTACWRWGRLVEDDATILKLDWHGQDRRERDSSAGTDRAGPTVEVVDSGFDRPSAVLTLTFDAGAAAAARAFVQEHFDSLPITLVEDAKLLVSELVTNARATHRTLAGQDRVVPAGHSRLVVRDCGPSDHTHLLAGAAPPSRGREPSGSRTADRAEPG